MTPIAEESLAFHAQKRGKIEVISTVKVNDAHDLSVAYTPALLSLVWRFRKMWINPMS